MLMMISDHAGPALLVVIEEVKIQNAVDLEARGDVDDHVCGADLDESDGSLRHDRDADAVDNDDGYGDL